eukprot:scaffold141_cov123-Isochrysis_galbana.AAC.7
MCLHFGLGCPTTHGVQHGRWGALRADAPYPCPEPPPTLTACREGGQCEQPPRRHESHRPPMPIASRRRPAHFPHEPPAIQAKRWQRPAPPPRRPTPRHPPPPPPYPPQSPYPPPPPVKRRPMQWQRACRGSGARPTRACRAPPASPWPWRSPPPAPPPRRCPPTGIAPAEGSLRRERRPPEIDRRSEIDQPQGPAAVGGKPRACWHRWPDRLPR